MLILSSNLPQNVFHGNKYDVDFCSFIDNYNLVDNDNLNNKIVNSSNYYSSNDILDCDNDAEFNSTTKPIDINKLNNDFIKEIKNSFEDKFVYFLKFNELDDFTKTHIEITFNEYFDKNNIAVLNWITDLWLEEFNNSLFILNIVKLLAKLKIKNSSIYTLVCGLFSHKNTELRDYALQFFASMSDEKSLRILKNTKISPQWLDNYRRDVIRDIEESLKIDR